MRVVWAECSRWRAFFRRSGEKLSWARLRRASRIWSFPGREAQDAMVKGCA